MIGFIRNIVKLMAFPLVYIGGIATIFVTLFKEAKYGLFLLVALIPQPNLYFKFHEYPMGKDFMDILTIIIFLGIIIQQRGCPRTRNTLFIFLFLAYSYFSLWNSSLRFSLGLPISTSNPLVFEWKNYMMMIMCYFLVVSLAKEEDDQKFLVALMSFVILFIVVRAFRGFSAGASFADDRRLGGPFETVLLGSNHYGAFIAYYSSVFLGLFFFDDNKKRKWLYLATYIISLHSLLFSYSRGAYMAAAGAAIFFGAAKKRSLIAVMILILIGWKAVLPTSVIDRITMTSDEQGVLEHSSMARIELWGQAIEIFEENPIVGVGFGGFGLTVPEDQLLKDTHNYFLKALCEQGIFGIVLFSLVLMRSFFSGYRLYRNASSPFHKGLAFGFMGCVIAMAIANWFGDRWSYYTLGAYFWIFWGIVDRGNVNAALQKAST